MLFCVSLLASIITVASAVDRYYHFIIESRIHDDEISPDCQELDSHFKHLFIVRDALNPTASDPEMTGPKIEADEGDMIHVQVTNLHSYLGTSIHWHGIHQIDTPYMDGTVGVTQCQLQPLASQNYSFVAYPPGTSFYHGHFSMVDESGIAGPIVIHPKTPVPYEYDEDIVIFLQDFYVGETIEQHQQGLLSYPFVWVGNPDAILMNGRAIAKKCETPANMTNVTAPGCLDGCASDPLNQLMNIKVETGKVYLLRFICATSLLMLNIAVGGHNLTIVAHDTTPTEPVEVTHFHIGPGQRYDVLLKATQPSGSYWLEATVIERNIPDLIGRGIIHYGSEKFLPTDEPFHPPWNDTDMCVGCDRTINPESYPEFPALTTPESEITRYTLVLNQVFLIENDGRQTGIAWGLNNITFAFTTPEPLIGMAVKAAKENGWPTEIPGTIDLPQNPATPWNYSLPAGSLGLPGQNAGGNGISVIRANYNQVFDIILQNTNMPTDPHPWHMHGHSFWVIGGGKGIFDAEKDVPKFNLKNPVLRDTVDMWSNGWTAIRFIAINPGVWFFHCHVLSHLRMGMAAAVVTQADEITDFPRVPNSVQYCNKIDSLEISADDSAGSSISISVSILAAAIASMLAYY